MNPKLLNRIFVTLAVIALIVAIGTTGQVNAALPTTDAEAVQSKNLSAGQTNLTFYDLNMDFPVSLDGPVSDFSIKFNPAGNWLPTGTVTMDVHISAFFSSLVMPEDAGAVSGLVGGDLSVYLNDQLVQISTLQQSGDQVIHVEFDSARLKVPSRGGINVLRFRWDGSASCRMNLLSNVVIMPESTLAFSYVVSDAIISLNSFPVPFIIEDSLQPEPLMLVLPDTPSLEELRAALIVAAGVGQLSGGTQDLQVFRVSDYAPVGNNLNLIVVADFNSRKSEKVQKLGKMVENQMNAGEGAISLFEPNIGGFGLLVTGDGEGIIKAAQVFSANQVLSSGDSETMIVSTVNPQVKTSGAEDTTLSDLGVGDILLTHTGGLSQSLDFYIPAGQQARADSYFGLIISHSQQLDYLSSGLQVKLNGSPTASIRLNDNTSIQNLFQLILPSSLIHAGRNTVELTADLNMLDMCSAPEAEVAWLRVSADSLLHIPLENAVASAVTPREFKDFPTLFLTGSRLDNVLMVLSPEEPGALQAAGMLAFQLGAALPQPDIVQLRAAWSDAYDTDQPEGTNIILIGKPSSFAQLAEKDYFPTMTFNPDNRLSPASRLEIVLDPAVDTNMGYLAIRGFTEGTSRVLLAVLGNNQAGIKYAVDAISSMEVAGSNFAMVVGKGVQSSWLDQGIATGKVEIAVTEETTIPEVSNATREFKTGLLTWALPLIISLLILAFTMVLLEAKMKAK